MGVAPFATVARVIKTHGVGGEFSLRPERIGDELAWLEGVDVWFVPPVDQAVAHTVSCVRPGPKGPLVALSDVSDPETARRFVGRAVVVRTADLPAGYPTETPEPRGLAVHDVERGLLGTVEDVIVTGANDVWVVRGGMFGEVLVPVIDDVVIAVDHEARTARVRLLPGLLEGEGES